MVMAALKTTDATVTGFEKEGFVPYTIVQKQLRPENWKALRNKDRHGISWKSSPAQVFHAPTSRDYDVSFLEDDTVESRHCVYSRLGDYELEIGDPVLRYYGIDEEDFLEPEEVRNVAETLNQSEIPRAFEHLRTPHDNEARFEEEDGRLKVPLVARLQIEEEMLPEKTELTRFPHAEYITQEGVHNPSDGLRSHNLYRGPWMQLEEDNIAGRVAEDVTPGGCHHLESTYFDSDFFNSENDGFPVYEVDAGSHPVPGWDRIDAVYMDLFREDPESLI